MKGNLLKVVWLFSCLLFLISIVLILYFTFQNPDKSLSTSLAVQGEIVKMVNKAE